MKSSLLLVEGKHPAFWTPILLHPVHVLHPNPVAPVVCLSSDLSLAAKTEHNLKR